MEGRVKVDNNYRSSDVVYLSPNQKVRLKGGELAVDAIEDYDVYRWREGLICFTNENFVDLMKRIEKYYGVKWWWRTRSWRNTRSAGNSAYRTGCVTCFGCCAVTCVLSTSFPKKEIPFIYDDFFTLSIIITI